MHFSRQGLSEIMTEIVSKQEFANTVLIPLTMTGFSAPDRFRGQPCQRLTHWLLEAFTLTPATRARLHAAEDWRSVLQNLWSDDGFWQHALCDGFDKGALRRLQHGLGANAVQVSLGRGVHPQIVADKFIFINTPDLLHPYTEHQPMDLRRRLKPLKGVYKVNGSRHAAREEDPQILVKHAVPPGMYLLSIVATYSHAGGVPLPEEVAKLYFGFGGALTEEATLTHRVVAGQLHVSGVLQLMQLVDFFRFDPSDNPCDFEVSQFQLTAIDVTGP